ncbi:hypothetical protein B7Z00_02955 [Candidatus Saccharibacteria bacterium 32-50-10]|nr:MAG: hypothetical protein B7Z00_02955 [Candidatus Saccharibacteria bacterium 32-50-10]
MVNSLDTSASIVFMPGVGAGSESWRYQIENLPDDFRAIQPVLPGLSDRTDAVFSLDGAVRSVLSELDRQGVDRAHVCGLSLGAVIATAFAATHPDRVSSLILSAGQVHPPKLLMKIQNAIIRLLPAGIAAPDGMSKEVMLSVLRAVAELDLRDDLARITSPTLVLCGAKDRPNIAAARQLANGIANAELQIVPGAGHEWNTQLPDEFSRRLNRFLLQQRSH